MDAMGIRAAIRAGTEMQMLATFTEGSRAHFAAIREQGLTRALSQRDESYGDYRTKS
jgi:enoyl-CoA hydratase